MQVRLHLAQGCGQGRGAAVGVGQRAVRVFPALVARAAAVVLDVAVAVGVSIAHAPLESRFGRGPERVGKGVVVSPVLGLCEGAKEQRGCVDRAVQDVRPEAALDDLAVADLVQDLAGLFLGVDVRLPALVLRQVAQHTSSQLGVDGQ